MKIFFQKNDELSVKKFHDALLTVTDNIHMTAFPPTNFNELQKCLALIERGDIRLEISKKNFQALREMINQADYVAKNSISEVAECACISPATLTRLAKLFGYRGFNEFQNIFKDRLEIPCDFYTRKLTELEKLKALSADMMLERQMTHASNNLQACQHNMEQGLLDNIISLLANASRIFIFGHKQSSVLASAMQYGLSLIRNNVQALVQLEHGLAIAIGQLKRADVVVLFASAPYSKITTKISSLLKATPCKVIVITDSDLSPLVNGDNLSVVIPTEGDCFTNSLAANYIFIESTLASIALRDLSRSSKQLIDHETLLVGTQQDV
jgi:DNA-binding MurR/RpiR family transcriptional regulator